MQCAAYAARDPRSTAMRLSFLLIAAASLAHAVYAHPQATPPSAAAPTPPMDAVLPPERTMQVDAVLLQSGRVVPGVRQFAVAFEGNAYLLSSEESRAAFNADPVRFAARDGGACGRMGPLGGLGDARRYAIEEGGLYFFASDDCLKAFREQPRRYMEPQDILPTGSPEQQAAGLAAVDRWVAWAGGREAVKAAGSFVQSSTRRVAQGKDLWDVTEVLEIAGPRTMRRLDSWEKVGGTPSDAVRFETVATPEGAAIVSSRGTRTPLARSRREAFERLMNRLPYAILRARFRPEAGFMAVKTGEGRLGDAECDYVVTWFDGNATYLAIEKSTGRLVQQGHAGRDASSRVTALTLDALAYAGPDALRLPTQWVTSRTGEKEGERGPAAVVRVGPAVTDPAQGAARAGPPPAAPALDPAPDRR